MPRPVHFEIPCANPQRVIEFYSTMFGWKFTKFQGPMEYWLITTGQGRNRASTAACSPVAILRSRAVIR